MASLKTKVKCFVVNSLPQMSLRRSRASPCIHSCLGLLEEAINYEAAKLSLAKVSFVQITCVSYRGLEHVHCTLCSSGIHKDTFHCGFVHSLFTYSPHSSASRRRRRRRRKRWWRRGIVGGGAFVLCLWKMAFDAAKSF